MLHQASFQNSWLSIAIVFYLCNIYLFNTPIIIWTVSVWDWAFKCMLLLISLECSSELWKIACQGNLILLTIQNTTLHVWNRCSIRRASKILGSDHPLSTVWYKANFQNSYSHKTITLPSPKILQDSDHCGHGKCECQCCEANQKQQE